MEQKIKHPQPITLENYEKIQNQARKCLCFCVFYSQNYCYAANGLLCKLPFPDKNNLLPVLIIDSNSVISSPTIKIKMKDDNREKVIYLKDRITWSNFDYNISIIEIKENIDKINNFIFVDDKLIESFNTEALFNETIYSMKYVLYSKEEEILISFGVIINDQIKENYFSIIGDYNDFLLMSIRSNKIIGISHNYSKLFITQLIKEFIQDKFYLENIIRAFINSNSKNIIGRSIIGNIYLIENNNKKYVIKEIENIEQGEKANYEEKNIALSKLNDKYIVKYYKIFNSQNRINILMEYAGNSNLQNFIQNNKGKLDEKIIESILVKICLGLKEIHNHSIIHRDLKPENIMINENNNIKIIDFGISKKLVLTKYTKSKVGSFYYMAPEIRKEEEIFYDNRVDIYSLGCIIYELFTGSKYMNDKMDGKVCKINTEKYSKKWQNIIDSLLKNDYKDRPYIDNVLNYFEKNTIIIDNEINDLETHKRYYLLNNEAPAENENLKEIDKYNSQLYISKELYQDYEIEFEKYFVPKEKGLYRLKMILFLPLRNCSYMFSKCNFQFIDISSINSINITNMSYMFSECYSLKKINLSSLKTENVVDMNHMFDGCKALLDIDLSSFDTKKVTNMSFMFSDCNSLKTVNLSSLNTENVVDMNHMFNGCKTLLEINLSSFDTKKVTNMSYMFNECGIKSIDLSKFDTKNVTNMSYMFNECGIQNIDLSKFDTSNLIDMSFMFSNLMGLKNIDLSSFNIKNVNNMECLFLGSHFLQNIDISSFNSTKDINANRIMGCSCCLEKMKVNENFYNKYCNNSFIDRNKLIFTNE